MSGHVTYIPSPKDPSLQIPKLSMPKLQPVLPMIRNDEIKKDIVEGVTEAITRSIIQPMKHHAKVGIIKAFFISEWACIIIASVGIICSICHIEEGKKITRICFLVYLGLQIIRMVVLL